VSTKVVRDKRSLKNSKSTRVVHEKVSVKNSYNQLGWFMMKEVWRTLLQPDGS
jgi:hypothetical protein